MYFFSGKWKASLHLAQSEPIADNKNCEYISRQAQSKSQYAPPHNSQLMEQTIKRSSKQKSPNNPNPRRES